ncbi:MAG TPA: hypothetical protein VMU22_00705 [Rhizomicrobium sp.]|nr:hypothetical protein [Rhizomicrobium sp.]
MPDQNLQDIKDYAVFIRFNRIVSAGGKLSPKAESALEELKRKHPDFLGDAGERADFDMWSSSGFRGPRGDPTKLRDTKTENLIEEALALVAQSQWEQGDLWSIICRDEPARAFDAIEADALRGRWIPEAWRPFLESVAASDDPSVLARALTLAKDAPDELLKECIYFFSSWLSRQGKKAFEKVELRRNAFELWDRVAAIVYAQPPLDVLERDDKSDLFTSALNEPGGTLANVLLELLSAAKPKVDAGMPVDIRERATLAASSDGRSGLLARMIFASRLAYIDSIDHEWAAANMFRRLSWSEPDARHLWGARAYDGRPGMPRMFNALKADFLETFQRPDRSHDERQALVAQLLRALMWKDGESHPPYEIESYEVRRAFATAPSTTRQTAAWLFMNWLRAKDEGGVKGETPDVRWRGLIGKTFREVWPLDAKLRDPETSHRLIWLPLSCDTEFGDAVDFVVNLIVPMRLFQISVAFEFEKAGKILLQKYPRPFLRLLNAAIDPLLYRVPEDLGEVLEQIEVAEPASVDDDAFRRLTGAWKLRQA